MAGVPISIELVGVFSPVFWSSLPANGFSVIAAGHLTPSDCNWSPHPTAHHFYSWRRQDREIWPAGCTCTGESSCGSLNAVEQAVLGLLYFPSIRQEMLYMRTLFTKFVLAVALLLVLPTALTAQTAATVTGVVTDASGAVLPDTAVVLTNPSTGVEYKATTNSAGSYHFGEIPPGPGYTMTFTHDGFSAFTVNNVYVNVANSRTQNAKLNAGANETVEVNAAGQGVTLNTEDATIGNNFQVEQLNDLPVQSRTSPAILFTLQPGITQSGATTGARVDQTNTTVDGQDVNDFATGNFGSIIGNAPIDSVQEFRGTTAGFTANSGQGGGGQFQLVTKSGTNHFHGNLNEYHRDNSTFANNWFNDNLTNPIRAPKLVRNQFGGNIGGPIKHDKAFFFFNYNAGRISQQAVQTRTVPLPSFAAGNISYINNGTGCLKTSRQNTTPACISQLTPAQVLAMDPAHKGESAALLALFKRYPAANDVTGGDGVNTGTFRFNSATPDNLSGYVGKIDYNLSTKINTLSYGDTVADLSFPRPANALGTSQVSFASGTTTILTAPYASPVNAQGRHVPIQQIADDLQWVHGRHSLSFGGFYKWIESKNSTVLDYNVYTLGLGGNTQGFDPTFRPANILPNGTVNGVNNGTTASVTFDSAYAAIIGRVGAVGTTYNYDASGKPLQLATGNNRDYKYKQTLLYAADTWKITPHITVSYGVNYQLNTVPYEVNGLETTQTIPFDTYLADRVAQSAAGNVTPNGLPFFTYVLGGKANNGPDLYHQQNHDFAPRFGFAWQPGFDPKTVFNGSAGMEYDRTVVNAVQF